MTSIELLESRIAPATFNVGAPNSLPGVDDVDYTDSEGTQRFFTNTEGDTGPISVAVGGGNPNSADTFFIELKAGDSIAVYNSTNGFQEYLRINAGRVVAFFVDKNLNNEVEEGELTGLSLGKNVSFVLSGAIEGDIVTNLDDSGSSLTVDMDGLISSKHGIQQITIGAGGVGGSILAGGTIKNLTINGDVGAILAGSAVNNPGPGEMEPGTAIDFFPNVVGGDARVLFTPGAGAAGASIQNIVVASVSDRIEAGGGGIGAKGGSVTKVQITQDADGVVIGGGDGGSGEGGRKNGGAGGRVQGITLAPPDAGDTSPNSLISISGGDGGVAATGGKGGVGGLVSDVLISFRLVNGRPFGTAQLVQDDVLVQGGAGGAGKIGGKGGDVLKSNVVTATPNFEEMSQGGEGGGEEPRDEIRILGGAGGENVAAGGKAGAGGSIKVVAVGNQAPDFEASSLLKAGDGGLANIAGKGGNGGGVSQVQLLGANVDVFGGNGSSGSVGGTGGSVANLAINVSEGVFALTASINAGIGGDAKTGSGGKGGKISAVSVRDGDFSELMVNEGSAGNGGSSEQGKGGPGGSVSGLNIFESDLGVGAGGVSTIRTGVGGNGAAGGGAGGGLTATRVAAVGLNVDVVLGSGGDVTGSGSNARGGAGGGASSLEILVEGAVSNVPSIASITAGVGGDGNGAGGNGGTVRGVSLRSQGPASIEAGAGGNAPDGAPGDGGSIVSSGAFGRTGAGFLVAGDAGAVGTRPANGGDVTGTTTALSGLYAQTSIMILGGNGTHGGRGGSLKNIGYGSASETLVPTPVGNILIKAGDGLTDGSFAGVGGSISNVSGSVSSGVGATTIIQAGNGGSAFVDVPIVETVKGANDVNEVQTIDLASFAGNGNAKLVLSFGSASTQSLDVRDVSQTPAQYATILATAINGLPGISPNGVSVEPGATVDSYVVTFTTVADKSALQGVVTLGTKGAKGGSVSNVTIERGGAVDGLLTVGAGDGGNATSSVGGRGGDVKNVSVANIEDGTIFRSIAAGNGGDGASAGGLGGSIVSVDVLAHDIGVRVGLPFGFDSMGGVFAGAGGKAGNSQAKNGSVIGLTADSIASIVAGRDLVPQEVAVVDNVYLNGFESLRESNGSVLPSIPGSQLVITFNGAESIPIAPNTPANDGPIDDDELDDVQDILNSMAEIQGAGNVTVTGNYSVGYTINFATVGDKVEFTAEESLGRVGEEIRPGSAALVTEVIRQGDDVPSAREIQVFAIDPATSFQVTFGASTTGVLAPTTTAAQLANELNALPSVMAAGGVREVTEDPVNKRYIVTFEEFVDQIDILQATALYQEVQQIDFYDRNLSDPDLAGTNLLTFTLNGETTTPVAVDADPIDVQNALIALPSVNPGDLTVSAGLNGAYVITFTSLGDKNLITGNQFYGVTVDTIRDGTAELTEIQEIALQTRSIYNTDSLPTANFVGGIADPLSLNGTEFAFIDTDGNDIFSLAGGDIPLDGLIVAKVYRQQNTNFIPEARLVDGTFYDFNNRI